MATNSYNWAQPQYSQPQASSAITGTGGAPRGRDDYGTAGYPTGSTPPGQGFNWDSGQMGSGTNTALMDWYSNGMFNPAFMANEGNRNIAEGYANYFAIPFFNASLANRQQNFGEAQFGATFGEQQRLNTSQMDLARQASGREDQALKFGQETNIRDFGEAKRQFDQVTELDRLWKTGQINAQTYANETQRLQAQWSRDTANFANTTDRTNVNNQFTLGQGQLQNQAFANQTERQAQAALAAYQSGQISLGEFQNQTNRIQAEGQLANQQFSNQTDRTNVNNQFTLGQGQLANQQFANQAQAQRFQGQTSNEAFANQTALQNVNNQFTLGQGQLGFQNRELDTNEAYRRSALGQEADLTREKFQNDLTQTRYQTFGRAKAPNTRASMSWY
jgi:hypothetical protein